MRSVAFAQATHTYTAPKGHDQSDVEIHDLHVMDDGTALTSIWVPSPEELDIIKKGGGITLSILSRQQPPVALGVVELDLSAIQEPSTNSG